MKRKLMYLLLLVFLGNACYGQSDFLGHWALNIDKSIDLMESQYRLQFDSLSVNAKARTRETMSGRLFIFDNDGSVRIDWKARGELRVSHGTWSVDLDAHTLHLIVDEIVHEYTYEMLDKDILILKSEEQRGFFSHLYFDKSPNK